MPILCVDYLTALPPVCRTPQEEKKISDLFKQMRNFALKKDIVFVLPKAPPMPQSRFPENPLSQEEIDKLNEAFKNKGMLKNFNHILLK